MKIEHFAEANPPRVDDRQVDALTALRARGCHPRTRAIETEHRQPAGWTLLVLQKVHYRQHVVNAINEDGMVVAKRKKSRFAWIFDAPCCGQRIAILKEFALIEQIHTHHGRSGFYQFFRGRLKRTVRRVEGGLPFAAQPNYGMPVPLLGRAEYGR